MTALLYRLLGFLIVCKIKIGSAAKRQRVKTMKNGLTDETVSLMITKVEPQTAVTKMSKKVCINPQNISGNDSRRERCMRSLVTSILQGSCPMAVKVSLIA